MSSPEELVREKIDPLLQQCGWILQNRSTINLSAARGIAIREALLKGRDEVDYLLFVDGKAIGTDLGDQTVKDWSTSDKTSSEGEARRVSAGSANQFQQFVTPDDGRKLAA